MKIILLMLVFSFLAHCRVRVPVIVDKKIGRLNR